MRILFLGDVSGRSGREGVQKQLPLLAAQYKPEAVIINAENAAAGFGVTSKVAKEFFDLGAVCLTTGNHVWDQRELLLQIDSEPRLLRPLNLRAGTPGKGTYIYVLPDGRKLAIANLIGRLFMRESEDPFAAAERLFSEVSIGNRVNALFIDFHAEATSEKMAFGHFCDGKASAVIGTHTHVPTADATILANGTAYQTDAGMCGDYDSVIGIKKEISISRFTRDIPGERMAPAEGAATVCGVYIETDDRTGLAQRIESFRKGGRLGA
jgi:metallophosphoesterase (TIGR00282 family)